MTIITLDTEQIGGVVATLGTVILGTYGYLSSKGYFRIWKKKLTLNLEVVDAAHNQNGHALTKLNMSDELVTYLQTLAPSADGTIDEETAIACVRDYIKWNNHIIRTIPNMRELKKN
jgi:hypothetical protein